MKLLTQGWYTIIHATPSQPSTPFRKLLIFMRFDMDSENKYLTFKLTINLDCQVIKVLSRGAGETVQKLLATHGENSNSGPSTYTRQLTTLQLQEI